ncbi:MAG: secretin N-terminal domain-containing protein [Phycisphaerae bacterium]
MEAIRRLVEQVDVDEATDNLAIQSFSLDLMDASTVANQVNFLLATIGLNTKKGEMKPFAFGEPTTNTLIVGAPPKYMSFISNLVTGIESKEVPTGEPRTYTLQYVRAEQIQPNVEALLQAKAAEKQGGRRGVQLPVKAVAIDESNSLVVYAQPDFQDLAKELITMLDKESASGEVVQIVKLERGNAEQLARTLESLQGGSSAFGGRSRRGGGDPSKVTIAADEGSNSLIFKGLPKDVAELQDYVKDIESKTELTSELRLFNLKFASTEDVVEVLTSMYAQPTGARGMDATDRVTITEDAYSGRVIVTASHRKLDEIASVIEQLDLDPYANSAAGEGLAAPGGKQIYFVDIYKGDAGEIAWDVEDLFPDVDEGGPDITSDWDGKYIKVVCRPGQFPAVEKAIRQIEARAKSSRKMTILTLPTDPKKQQRYLQFLKGRMESVNIEFAPADDNAESLVETLRPEAKEKKLREKERNEISRRSSAGWKKETKKNAAQALYALVADQQPTSPTPATTETRNSPAVRNPAQVGTPAFRLATFLENNELNKTLQVQDAAEEAPEAMPQVADQPLPPVPQREAATVVVRPDGKVLVSGPESEVDEVEDIFDILEEDLSEGQVIRIFEFTYGDVNAAAEVLNIMFNERQQIQIPQQRNQQQQQQQQQQQRGQRGDGDGDDDNNRNQQGGLAQQIQQMVGGRNQQQGGRRGAAGSGQRLRIATDASHNYLIIKCDEADLPEIRKLLRELDIPPGDVDLKVFQLVNLDATETAENIKAVLGVDKAKSRRGGGAATAARGGNQQQLLEMLQTQMVNVPGVEGGAKVESVEIVPNVLTNSIMVSAPPEVMKLIETILTELEDLEGRGVVGIYYYDLENARVTDVLPLLKTIFDAAASGKSASPASLGPVTLSADPRNNRIIFTAEAKDVERVRSQIATLDIGGALADAETHMLQFGNAEQIAQTLQAIFAPAARGEAAGGDMLRIAADGSTNTITVWGPLEKRNEIFEKMFELEQMSVRAFREITVVHADAEELAEKLSGIFGASRLASSRGGQGASQSPGSVVIFGDENAKKLLVKAPEAMFEQIKEMVFAIDQPDNKLQMKNFQLQYADAEILVEKVKSAFVEYVAMLPRSASGKPPFDPFTAVADPRTNSVTVVGTEETFLFVGSLLAEIDVPASEERRKQFRVFAMDKADAVSVADAINAFARGGELMSAGGQGRGRGPGSNIQVPILDVNAVAEPTVNAVMVFGKTDDIDIVKAEVIDQLENLTNIQRFETIAVQQAVPSQIINFIEQFLDDYNVEGGQGEGAMRRGPRMIPNDNAKEIVVKGTPRAIEEVRELVLKFDNPDLMGSQIKVRRVEPGRPAVVVAQEVERVVNQIEQQQAQLTNRMARPVVLGTDEYSNSIIIAADPAMIGMVDAVIDQIEAVGSPKQETRVIQLANLSAEDAASVIRELQDRSTGSSGRGRSNPFGGFNRGNFNRGGFDGGNFNRGNFDRGRFDRGGDNNRRRNRIDGNRRSGRGAFRINTTPFQHVIDTSEAIRTSGRATIAATSFMPTLLVLLADQVAQQPDQTPRRALGADGRRDRDAANPAPAATPAADGVISGVSGSLENEVTVQEISNKQIIVSGDADDLNYIEQILALMEASKVPTRIEIFTLEQAKATTVATVVTEVMTQYVESLGTPGPEDRFSVSVEAKSNSLIVSASETNMEIIAELIQRIDVANVEGQTDFKSVPLDNAWASEVVAQLTPTLERLATIRNIPAEARPSIQAIDQSNSVLVIGTPADVEEITRLIKEIDITISEDAAGNIFSRAEVILIPLKNAVAEDVAEVLTTMIEEQQTAAREAATGGQAGLPYVRKLALRLPDGTELPELDLQKPIKIIPESGTNSLIIFSAAKNLVPLQAIVGVFDTLPRGNNVNVRAFVLTYARAEAVATMLEEVFTKGKGALRRAGEGSGDTIEKGVLPPEPPNVAGKGLPYNVAVTHDNRSNTVVVIGHEDAVLLAGGLIAEIDRPSAQLGVEPHVIELKNIAATKIAESIQNFLDQRAQGLGAEGNEARDSAIVVPDDRSNLLVVYATREMYEFIEKLARQIDDAPAYTPIGTRIVKLDFADAMKLQALLQEFYDKRRDAEVGDEPKNSLSVLADSRTNSLLMTGTRDWLREAEEFIEQMDREGAAASALEVAIIPIRFNSAGNVASLLQDVVDKSKGQDEEGTPITISADPVSQNLIVAASREDLARVRRWIDLIDTPAGDRPGLEVAIIPLERGSAEELAQRINDLYTQDQGGGQGEFPLTVTHDPITNSIVVRGPSKTVVEVQGLIARMGEIGTINETQVRIFALKQADAETAAELIQNILEGRGGVVGSRGGSTGGGGSAQEEAARQVMLIFQQRDPSAVATYRAMRKDIVVTADVRTNSLFVTAPPQSMPLMESLVNAIDVPPRSDEIDVFALRNSDAQQMVTTLQEIFSTTGSSGTGGQGRTGGGTGTQDEQERQLSFGGASGAGREQISFTADIRTNSVIAAGTPGYLKLVEELVYQLDTQPIEDRKTLVYSPRNIVAAELATSIRDYSDAEQQRLDAMGEEISVQRRQEREIVAIDNEDANRVILSYSPRFESQVMDIVRELDQPPPQVSIEVLIVEVTLENSLELGIEYAFQDLQFTKAGPTDTTTFDFVGGTDVGAAGSGLGGFTFTISGADFNFLFRTLQSEQRLKVLSRPHIVAMNNQEAQIEVVDDVPYISGTGTSIAGQVSTQVSRESIGILLTVTPQINPDGFVRMEIRQEVSDISGSTVQVGPGVNAPIFFRRIADTTVTVRDGETIILGGLITSRKEKTETKVPLLGDLPVAGALFRATDDSERQTELLVILTPRVIRSVEDFREESIALRDKASTLPGDVLTHPLMNRLRLQPEDLHPQDQDGVFGSFERAQGAPDAYGAARFEQPVRYPEPAAPAPQPYDLPLPAETNRAAYDLPIPSGYRQRR